MYNNSSYLVKLSKDFQNLSSYGGLFTFIYFFKREREETKEKGSWGQMNEVCHFLIHPPDGHNHQGYGRLEPRARNFVPVFHMGASVSYLLS